MTTTKKYKLKYGLLSDTNFNDFELEKYCFKRDLTGEHKSVHLKNMMTWTMPQLVWNEWLEKQMYTFCDDTYAQKNGKTIFRNVSMVGCASAGKTFSAGIYAFHWWLPDPFNSIVILTSTTKEMIGSRVWPVIQMCYQSTKFNLAKAYGVKPDNVDVGNLPLP